MRAPILSALTLLSALVSSSAIAQTSTTGVDVDALREQIKEELRQELAEQIKAELKTELVAEGAAPGGGVQEDTWAEEEWKWEEPVKPELNFFEIDGYFRFRYDLFHNFGLGIYNRADSKTGVPEGGPFAPGTAPPVTICETDQLCAEGKEDAGSTLGGANIRLRLEPTLNVSEDIKLHLTVDVLDNVVLGSTPDGFPRSIGLPIIAFSQTQLPPSDTVNALVDSIRVKRAWAEVMTPLGQLRVGRMASHIGLGIMANEGQGIDSDYGDSVDRILFATKIAGHYIIPGFDWAVSGPTSAYRDTPQGQAFDREQRDDVDQYLLAIVKRDKDQEIKEKLENDEIVLNYGTYLVHRSQTYDAGVFYGNGDPNQGPAARELVLRDAKAYIGSLWVKFIWRKLLLEAEVVGILGDVSNGVVQGNFAANAPGFDIEMYGAALRGEYKLLHDALTIHFLAALASGDPTPGWGVYPLSNTTPQPGDWDGSQQANDNKISNFRFDPDFQVDLILWRQLVGTLTDAFVIRPGVQYNLTEGLGARLDFVYSHAMYAASTPSGIFGYGGTDKDPDPNLGLEADLKLFYMSEDGFHAWLEYGLLIPFAGLDRRIPNTNTVLSSEVAQTIQVLFGVTF